MDFYILPENKGFYDPDGYFFDEKGFDEFGGYYDNDGVYHPGEGNKHEFPDREHTQKDSENRRGGDQDQNKGKKKDKYQDDDDLIRAFERGDDEDYQDDYDEPDLKKYLHEFKKVEEIIAGSESILEEEQHPLDDEDEYYDEQQPRVQAVPKY